MSSPYTIESFTIKENKVDIVDAAHMNAVQDSIENIETALNAIVNDDGTLIQSASFPTPVGPGQLYFRTDLDTIYYRNAADSAWTALAGTLSNVLFCWGGFNGSSTDTTLKAGSTRDPNAVGAGNQYSYISAGGSTMTYKEIKRTKFKKDPGINTLTVYWYGWGQGSGANRDVYLRATIGAATGNSSLNTSYTAPAWGSFTVDVSGLVNGTIYDMIFDMQMGTSEIFSSVAEIIVFGS